MQSLMTVTSLTVCMYERLLETTLARLTVIRSLLFSFSHSRCSSRIQFCPLWIRPSNIFQEKNHCISVHFPLLPQSNSYQVSYNGKRFMLATHPGGQKPKSMVSASGFWWRPRSASTLDEDCKVHAEESKIRFSNVGEPSHSIQARRPMKTSPQRSNVSRHPSANILKLMFYLTGACFINPVFLFLFC